MHGIRQQALIILALFLFIKSNLEESIWGFIIYARLRNIALVSQHNMQQTHFYLKRSSISIAMIMKMYKYSMKSSVLKAIVIFNGTFWFLNKYLGMQQKCKKKIIIIRYVE